MKIIILFNPYAGRGKAHHALDEAVAVLRRAGAELELRESPSAAHLIELAREASEIQPDIIVAAGGDGTVHCVLNGLVGSKVPLGIIPVGRGNDFARGLEIPFNTRAAAEVLLKNKLREIDLARARGSDSVPSKSPHLTREADVTVAEAGPWSVVYGCVAGVGFDSVVNRFANDRAGRLQGRFAYGWGILRCLKSYRAQPLKLTADDQTFHGEVMLAAVGNSTSYGDGVKITPRARLDDGLLDVCIVPAMSKWELLRWVPGAYSGRHLAHPTILYFQARRITLRSTARLELFADGEFLNELPATIEVIPRALRVVVPA